MNRRDQPEEMDREDADPAELVRSLGHLAQINGWLGGWWSARQALAAAFSGRVPKGVTVLDVATGAGDIARRLERRWRRDGVRVVALDLHPVTLEYARRHTPAGCQVEFVRGDALALPLRSGSVDVALCSLALHHFSEEAAVCLLAGLNRVTRDAVVVADLRRSAVAWALIWLLTRLLWRSPITRHDGPVSVRRAFTPGELGQLAERAGLAGARVFRQPFFRMALVYRKRAEGSG